MNLNCFLLAAHLKRQIGIEIELGHELCPRLELLRLVVDVVVEYGALGGKLDRLELGRPPLGELDTMIGNLHTHIQIKSINSF